MKKVNSLSLEKLGAQNFSEQSFGAKVSTKDATMVGCFDKQTKRDEDGEEESTAIHFQFFGRSVLESPLLKFERVNEKYERRLIRDLSKGAKRAAVDLRMARGDGGSWESKHEAAKDLKCARSNAYRHLNELTVKDYLVEDEQGRLHLHMSPDLAREFSIMEQKTEEYNAARAWLHTYLIRPVEAANVLIAGDEQGHDREDLIKGRRELKFVEEERLVGEAMVGTIFWRPKKRRSPGIAVTWLPKWRAADGPKKKRSRMIPSMRSSKFDDRSPHVSGCRHGPISIRRLRWRGWAVLPNKASCSSFRAPPYNMGVCKAC